MKRMVVTLSLTLVLGITLGMAGSRVLYAQQEPIKRTVLVKSDLEGIEGKEAILFLAELVPGAVGGKHYHSGTELFYAVEGAFTHEPNGKSPVTLKQGQAGVNPHKGVHYIRNASATESARILGCLIADKGQPMTVPVK